MKRFLGLLILVVLTACNRFSTATTPTPLTSSAANLSPDATASVDCGCTIDGPLGKTPTSAVNAAGPAGPQTAATLAEDVSPWAVYQQSNSAFSFEYPAAYDQSAYSVCAVKKDADSRDGSQLHLGSEITITQTNTAEKDLTAIIREFEQQPDHQDFQFEPAETQEVSGAEASLIRYASKTNQHFMETMFVLKGSALYQIDLGAAPQNCDVTEAGISETDAYAHLIETFTLQP